jgi:ATP-dependent Lon protease
MSELDITLPALKNIIYHYTLEAGVRQLSREIAKICRKVVTHCFNGKKSKKKVTITPEVLEEYLGVWRHKQEMLEHRDTVGVVKALAWTATGGDLLVVESILYPGQQKVTLTGRLGDTMQESFKAAFSLVRSYLACYGFDETFFEKHDIHLHVPQGATPKDGPSAGITMCVALLSLFTKTPVRGDLAMTGEVTLRGEVLAIGGLKEKLLAARRADIKRVIIPYDNLRDLKEIAESIKEHIEICPVKNVEEVFNLSFRQPLNIPQVINIMSSIAHKASADRNLTTIQSD